MDKDYYTVQRISEMLDIHPKTIQRYIREGKLRASKVGKGWRVNGHDLSLFLEGTNISSADSATQRTITVSSVIDISTNGTEDVMQIMNLLSAALVSKPPEFSKTTIQSQYIESENKIRVTLAGDIRFMSAIVDMLSTVPEH